MNRRDFLLMTGAALAAPVQAVAQSANMPTVGILMLGNPDPSPFVRELKQGLRDLGYVEGRNIRFELRSAEGNSPRLAPLAADLVAMPVDVLVAFQTPAATVAKAATPTLPIVMAGVGDPVGTGLIDSLDRPGGNLTGVSGAAAELGAKNVELIHEVFPSARRIAFLANVNDPLHRLMLRHVTSAGNLLRVEIKPVLVTGAGELEGHFTEVAAWGAEAVLVQPSLPNRPVADLAIRFKLPAVAPHPSFTHAGGLMSYAADFDALYRQGAGLVDKVIKGRKPADLPVELATKYRLTLNLRTARALEFMPPPTLLARADEVIE